MRYEQTRVNRDAYFLITVKWLSGFSHKVPCRGYGLKSQLDFTQCLEYVESFSYEETTKEDYEFRVFGDGSEWESQPVADTKSKKSKTPTKSPPKSGPSVKKGGRKPSATKVSATPAKKSVKKTTKSSTTSKKKTTG
jgi:hypothetical protein